MKLKKLAAACGLALTALFGAALPAHAQFSGDVIKIGIITDMSGVYGDIDGMGGVETIRMAVQEMGGAIGGKKIEVLFAEHQNKADVAASKAREWFDTQGVDMLIGGTNSGTALAMAKVAAEKKKPFLVVGAATSALTNDQCNPYTLHWAYDTTALAKGTGNAVVKSGGKSWYFLTADYAFGHQLQSDTEKVVKASGGQVVGSVRHPLNASDFSSFLLQAQASKAQILGMANAGGDTVNTIKGFNEFGLNKTMKLAGMLIFINEIHALGLKATQGLYLTDSWYWNQSAETRNWSRKFFDKFKRMPSSVQAADYSAALQYLTSVKAVNSDDPEKVLAHMKKTKFNDVFMKNGYVRADGRVVHDMYLMQVKAPDASKEPWDYYNVVQVLKGEEPWGTKADTKCPLWK
ncbi:ABC transporter substrate-binding protein [Ramlibacter sp.]|uniref:ABC transporter substrate-binding protein n=1 Tax=Ramlibacter sp. TaxID=1917967 RepID=UPI003D13E5F5